MWKFCGKAHFPQSFGQFARNSTETVPFHKILHRETRLNSGITRSGVLNTRFVFLQLCNLNNWFHFYGDSLDYLKFRSKKRISVGFGIGKISGSGMGG